MISLKHYLTELKLLLSLKNKPCVLKSFKRSKNKKWLSIFRIAGRKKAGISNLVE